ncbi:MAG: hypothetical protein ACLPPF_18265 [Rhodomicrobium sp.]
MDSRAQAGRAEAQSETPQQANPASIEEQLLAAMRRWEAEIRELRETEEQHTAQQLPN